MVFINVGFGSEFRSSKAFYQLNYLSSPKIPSSLTGHETSALVISYGSIYFRHCARQPDPAKFNSLLGFISFQHDFLISWPATPGLGPREPRVRAAGSEVTRASLPHTSAKVCEHPKTLAFITPADSVGLPGETAPSDSCSLTSWLLGRYWNP